MKIITWSVETPMQGANWSGEIEVDDTATDEEIGELVREEVFNIVSYGWGIKGD